MALALTWWLAGLALLALAVATLTPAMAAAAALALAAGVVARRRAPRASGLARLLAWVAAIAMTALAGGLVWLVARAAPSRPDGFYATDGPLPDAPGRLLRVEPFMRVVPAGTRVWRILFTTTRRDDAPAVGSAIVLVPATPSSAPRPVILWTHGTTGVAGGCAPSVLPAPYPFDPTLPALDQAIAAGWAIVAPDYVGLGTAGGHPYLIGEPEGRSSLDAVRAARQVPDLGLDARTLVWGHSQGGHAALWTGILAPRYAPDVVLAGVAALAPATDLPALLDAAQHHAVGQIMASYLVTAYAQEYPDVAFEAYVGPTARGRALAGRCLSGPGVLVSLLTAATLEQPFFARPPTDGPLAARLAENVPAAPIGPPLLVAQGLADALVLPPVQARFVRARCDAGQALEYRTYAGRDHVSLVAGDTPLAGDLVQWTRERFEGAPAPEGCRTVTR